MEILKFNPIFKPTLWGSETWLVSAVKGSESVVINGECRGMTLPEVVEQYGEELLGKHNVERFGTDFPLLIKFIYANQDLSIQVHPDDELAQQRHGKMGKNEMWYVVDADRGSQLIAGFRHRIDMSDYAQKVADGSIEHDLNKVNVMPGDCFYIPAGRVHGIGAGMVIAEIQQTSDVTYRIYDYKRKDADGNYRELHTELAAESIDYTVEDDYRTAYESRKNEGVGLVSCPYFSTAVYDLDEPMTLDYSELDSFVILIALQGNATITDNEGNKTSLNAGETVLIPATTQTISVDGEVKFLETYV